MQEILQINDEGPGSTASWPESVLFFRAMLWPEIVTDA